MLYSAEQMSYMFIVKTGSSNNAPRRLVYRFLGRGPLTRPTKAHKLKGKRSHSWIPSQLSWRAIIPFFFTAVSAIVTIVTAVFVNVRTIFCFFSVAIMRTSTLVTHNDCYCTTIILSRNWPTGPLFALATCCPSAFNSLVNNCITQCKAIVQQGRGGAISLLFEAQEKGGKAAREATITSCSFRGNSAIRTVELHRRIGSLSVVHRLCISFTQALHRLHVGQ